MTDTERMVRLAALAFAARESLRSLWGDEYESKIEEWRDIVRRAAVKFQCSPVAAVQRIDEAMKGTDCALNLADRVALISAALDVAEDGP